MPASDRQARSAATPSPAELYKQTGGGDAYRVAMLDHGYLIPTSPWERKPPGKRVLQCGLTHDLNWTEWQRFSIGENTKLEYEARWCRTCATTQARELRDVPA
jgi:hypothetical protein